MEIYLVGGAVRDELLGFPINERDWVVVGSTVPEMLKLGYRQVGKDFPVFLHPKTQEEYALARTERKIGPGYKGFEFDASAQVSLEQDLSRRDLTINAIAKNESGEIIDPFHGQADLKNKVLRHVSKAFTEDPVRILRIARFTARFHHLGFQVAEETLLLMKQMVAAGEVDALVSERVWKEWERAFTEKNPEMFFKVLEASGALAKLFPTVTPYDINVLTDTAKLTDDPVIRLAVMFCHKKEAELKALSHRYRLPNAYQELAFLILSHFDSLFLIYVAIQNSVQEASPRLHVEVEELAVCAENFLQLFTICDAFRRRDRFIQFLEAAHILMRVSDSEDLKVSFWDTFKPLILSLLDQTLQATKNLDTQNLAGQEIACKIKTLRLEAIQAHFRRQKS